MILITLTAKKVKLNDGLYKGYYETQFFKPDGSYFATIPAEQRQPHKNKKQIVLNCYTWNIQWTK